MQLNTSGGRSVFSQQHSMNVTPITASTEPPPIWSFPAARRTAGFWMGFLFDPESDQFHESVPEAPTSGITLEPRRKSETPQSVGDLEELSFTGGTRWP